MSRSRRLALEAFLGLVLVAATTWTYANHFENAFQFDDVHAIVENAYLERLDNIPRFFRDGTTLDALPQNQSYRPFLVTTFAIDHWLGDGHRPAVYHRTTFLLFLAQAGLMFVLYARLLGTAGGGARLTAFLAVAWYVLHPANAETINYILARSDSLSTLLVVLGLVWRQRWPRGHLYLVPVALGILTKPTAVMFAPLLFLQILFFEHGVGLGAAFRRAHRAAVGATLRASLPSLVVCGGLFLFTRAMESPTWYPGGPSRVLYILTQPFVALRYAALLVAPVGLSADTDWKAVTSPLDVRVLVGGLFVAATVALIVACSRTRRHRPIAYGLAWFLIAQLPTAVVPLAEVTNDHRMFYPFVGLVLAAAWALRLLVERLAAPRAATALALLALVGYAQATHRRNEVWRTPETLWRDVAETSPKNGRGLMNYGLTLMARADYAGARRYFNRALELTPRYGYLRINLGILDAATGDKVGAERELRLAVELDPGNPETHYHLGRFLRDEGRLDEARRSAERALALAGGHSHARQLLRDTLLDLSLRGYQEQRFEASLDDARRALAVDPRSDLACNNIVAALNALGRWDEAVAAGERALELNPKNERARANLAWARQHQAR